MYEVKDGILSVSAKVPHVNEMFFLIEGVDDKDKAAKFTRDHLHTLPSTILNGDIKNVIRSLETTKRLAAKSYSHILVEQKGAAFDVYGVRPATQKELAIFDAGVNSVKKA